MLSKHPAPAARLAALELQYHVLRITGAELPIRTDNENVTGPRVLIGESSATREMGLKGADFAPQEYLIAFRRKTLVLIGRDWEDTQANRREFGRPMSCGDTMADTRQRIDYWKTVGLPGGVWGKWSFRASTMNREHATPPIDFLERFCDVRWYGPTEMGIVVPSRKTLVVKGADIRRSPALKYRDALWSGSWPFMQGQWGPVTRPEVFLFWRRLRLGGEKWAGNHTFHRKTVETMLNKPEYQAKGPGRGTQLCYTNPQLIQEVAQIAHRFLRQRKGMRRRVGRP